MAFWGVKIKARKPYTIPAEDLEGRRLRITQATLGVLPEENEEVKRSVVKCRVDGAPVFICSLRAGVVESIPLNLCFEEPVTLFVMGETAVHLCGYYEEPDYQDDEEDLSDDEMDLDFIQDDEDELEDSDEELPILKGGSSVKLEEILEDDDEEKGKVAVQADEKEEASEDEDGFMAKRKAPSGRETPSKKQKTGTQSTPGAPETSSKKKKKKAAKQDAKQNGEADKLAEEPAATPGKGKSKGDKKRFANGLEVENLKMGKPDGKQAKSGKKVFIHYIGKLVKNGKIFDSTVGKKPFAFRLGVNEVIRGFDIGIAGMRVGDKRRVTVPPAMGYRDKSMGPIPPNSWLCFDIELVAVK